MGRTVASLLSARPRRDAVARRRGLLASIALLALSVGAYSAATVSPALAVNPDLTAPERVYTGISQEIAFTNVVDPISDDNRTIAVTVADGAVCHTDPNDASYSITGCSRVQMDLSTNGSGLLFIPNSTTATTQYTNNVKVIVAASGAIIDQATDSNGGPSLVYHISGTEAQINDTLSTLKFQPTPGYETLAIQPTILHIVAINGVDSVNTAKDVEIKIEGGNGAPTLTVPAAPVDAPTGTGNPNDSGTTFPVNPADPPLATVVDPEMCNLTVCGQPYTNPGGVEDDDAMLLVAWLDTSCGQFHFRGGSFPVIGGVLNSTVLALLTNVDTGQNPGLDLAGEQAAPILSSIGLQAQTVDLQLQSSDITTFTNTWAGVGSLDDVRYAMSQITYRGPTDDATCVLHIAASDLGNSGMPAPHGYVGSPIGGADQPQPGYEIPDAKADVQAITFHVHDTHPDVTIEQKDPVADPTNQPIVFTAHFSEAMQSLTAADLTITGPGNAANTSVSPAGSATDYDITVSPTSDGVVTVALAAGQVVAAANPDAQHNNDASTSTDNSVTFDGTKPNATLTASAAQSGSPVLMTVSFDENVDPAGFGGTDVTLSSSGGDSLSGFVTPLTATSFQIAVVGMVTNNSTITATVAAAAVQDLAGNDSNASNQVSVTWTNGGSPDTTNPTVTVDQAGVSDPTSVSPIAFTAVFDEPVIGFTAGDVTLGGAAAIGASASISGAGPTYTISVSGMTQSGVLSASIGAGKVVDLSGNPNDASTSIDNSVTYNKPGSATHFSVTAPPAAQRNTPFSVVVTALDASNATATGYSGTVHFTSSDGTATLPVDSTLVNGTKTFSVTLVNVIDGNYTVTATDTVSASITGTSANVALSNVAPAVATHFSVTSSASTVAGAPLSVTVTALTAGNATATSYNGTVHFTSSDFAAVLPADSMLVNGTTTFSVTMKTAGGRTLTATDTVTASINGSVAGGITVTPAAVDHFTTSAPASATSDVPFTTAVTAKDAYNNTVTAYGGTVHFTSSDGAAVLPANSTLVNGTKSFSVTLKTAGNQMITATDTVTATITGTSMVNVPAPAPATHFSVTTVGTVTAGNAISVTVTALTAANAPTTNYSGTVQFTSTDGSAVLPADSALVNGTGTFSATLAIAGNQTITATDSVTASINGTTGTVVVTPAAASHFTVSIPASTTQAVAFTAVVTAFDAFNNIATGYANLVAITASGGTPTLPAPATLANGTGLFSVTFANAGSFTVTATENGQAAPTGTSTMTTVSSTPQPVADHFTVAANASATAGSAFNVTVIAVDATNAPTSNYSGTLDLTSASAGTLPTGVSLINGVGIFPVALTIAGPQTVTATDTATASITGVTATIAVASAAATHFTVSAPASAVTNAPISVTVTALDSYSNIASGYGGLAHFTSTDPAAVLPVDAGLVNGVGSFSATMKTSGSRTITATDTVTASTNGVTSAIAVSAPATATHFSVTANASSAAGAALTVTVTALDSNNLATANYAGTVHFTSSDGGAVLPADLALIGGVGMVSVTLQTAGLQTITATDTLAPWKNGVTGSITVTPLAATHLTVTAPVNASNGFAASAVVTAKDQYENTATGYSGTVHLTSTDGGAVLPADSTLSNGSKTFSVTFTTNGNQTVTATDTVTASINGTSGTINVSPAPPNPATHFSITTNASATAGTSITVTVTALDAGNAATSGYAGSVHFTSTDGSATLPADSTLLNGVGMFSVTLRTGGNQTVTAADTGTPSISGVSGNINIVAASATHLGVSAPAAATAGAPVSVIITALDQFGNRDTGYPGMVHITSTDAAAVLPADNSLVNGIGTFPVTLNTLGNATVTATDTVNNAIAGSSGGISVSNVVAGAATHFSVSAPASATAGTAFSVTITALDAGNATASGYSGTVHFTSTSAGTLPADVALVNGVAIVSPTLTASGNQTITATDTASASITGTSGSIGVAAAAAAQLKLSVPVLIQLTAFNSITRQVEVLGSQYTFTVIAVDQFANTATSYAGIVHFASDDPTATLPPDSPLTNGVGTFTAIFNRTGSNNLSVVDLANPTIIGATVGGVVVAPTPTLTMPDPGSNLPATGTDSASPLWIATLLILCGGAALALRTRRRRTSSAT